MNLPGIKLALAGLWLLPGVIFLILDWAGGPTVALPVAGRQIPLAWPFIVLGLFNLLRWWTSRTPRAPDWIERRRPRNEIRGEPDPNFRFEEEV
jgi:hypothetical protein